MKGEELKLRRAKERKQQKKNTVSQSSSRVNTWLPWLLFHFCFRLSEHDACRVLSSTELLNNLDHLWTSPAHRSPVNYGTGKRALLVHLEENMQLRALSSLNAPGR